MEPLSPQSLRAELSYQGLEALSTHPGVSISRTRSPKCCPISCDCSYIPSLGSTVKRLILGWTASGGGPIITGMRPKQGSGLAEGL